MSKPHKEAKRLAKSIKRRRIFAEQLRIEANAVRASAQTLDMITSEIEKMFAARIDMIADRELATAREEEAAHMAVSQPAPSTPMPPPDPQAAERQARAFAVLAERGSSGRIHYMADNFKIGMPSDHPSDLLRKIEAALDREKMDTPSNREGMTYGQRISNAEKLFYGQPRF